MGILRVLEFTLKPPPSGADDSYEGFCLRRGCPLVPRLCSQPSEDKAGFRRAILAPSLEVG